MRRYSYYTRQNQPYRWINAEFIVPTEQAKSQLVEASRDLHNFGLHLPGRKRHRRDARYADLDTDFMTINVLMHLHLYPGLIRVEPARFPAGEVAGNFDMLVEVPTREEAHDILETAEYLRQWGVWVKGRGDKKPGSRVWKTIPDENQVFVFLKQLGAHPEKVLAASTGYDPGWLVGPQRQQTFL